MTCGQEKARKRENGESNKMWLDLFYDGESEKSFGEICEQWCLN